MTVTSGGASAPVERFLHYGAIARDTLPLDDANETNFVIASHARLTGILSDTGS
jgi:hypothetical protein